MNDQYILLSQHIPLLGKGGVNKYHRQQGETQKAYSIKK
ncbi:hypothetical protein SAMN05443549_104165 [Flavobacterium fluvii]|uniref:Uncharacterized protein n=1 Tax=Flavobacterium fluvii TaxID=468056 RepID=A0A1M5K3G6_9FLAO|nr:hypothetical protein SAMN05443549_104165 [Flavobacterium fluvii]